MISNQFAVNGGIIDDQSLHSLEPRAHKLRPKANSFVPVAEQWLMERLTDRPLTSYHKARMMFAEYSNLLACRVFSGTWRINGRASRTLACRGRPGLITFARVDRDSARGLT
jgi:hypothetical protein